MPKNMAIKPPIMLSLASWTANTRSGMLEKTVFAFDKSFKPPDEEADATDEGVDPLKLWPQVVGKQHPCQDSTKTLMVEFMEEVPAIQSQRVNSHLRLQ